MDVLLRNELCCVEIVIDGTYTVGSADNRHYDLTYNPGNHRRDCNTTFSIEIDRFSEILRIALVGEFYSNEADCAVLDGKILTVLQHCAVIQIDITDGSLLRYKELDCFGCTEGIYRVENGYIIRGEAEIIMLNLWLEKLWGFIGRDIFASPSNINCFEISGNTIKLVDWQNYYYEIDFNGKTIKEGKMKTQFEKEFVGIFDRFRKRKANKGIEAPLNNEQYRYCEWDKKNFELPDEYLLDDNSDLADALNVFYSAGGYDFFNVIDPKYYSGNWLDFIGSLYQEIAGGKYVSSGRPYVIPLHEKSKQELGERGVPEVFITDGVDLCDYCRDIVLQNAFYTPQDWLNCLEYIKDLLDSGKYELIESTCGFDEIRDENGKWTNDVFSWVIRCRSCGQEYTCSANTYHGRGSFERKR